VTGWVGDLEQGMGLVLKKGTKLPAMGDIIMSEETGVRRGTPAGRLRTKKRVTETFDV